MIDIDTRDVGQANFATTSINARAPRDYRVLRLEAAATIYPLSLILRGRGFRVKTRTPAARGARTHPAKAN